MHLTTTSKWFFEMDNLSIIGVALGAFNVVVQTGMKIGWNLKTGLNRRLTAWKNWDDPSPGDFTWGMVLGNPRELVMSKGSKEYYRSGPWNGVRFSGKTTPRFNLELWSTPEEVYYTYNFKGNSFLTRVVLNQSDYHRHRYNWIEDNKTWSVYSSLPRDNCDNYNRCGPYGNCILSESPQCRCLMGFKPKSVQNYESWDWSQGCVQGEPLSCGVTNKDDWDDPSPGNFIWGMVLGNTPELVMWKGSSEYYRSGPWNGVRFNGKTTPIFNLELETTSDEVYYTYNLDNKSLITRVVLNQSLYSRQRYNWIEENQTWRLYSSVPRDNCDTYNLCGPFGNCIVNESPPCQCLSGFKPKSVQNYDALDWSQGCVLSEAWSCGVKRKDGFTKFEGLKMPDTTKKTSEEENAEGHEEELEVPLFDFATIVRATHDFSSDKRLGQGGFGPVYRGTLDDGQEIAAKRLSNCSGQGIKEFKNEVILCAKLQHRNLVKVLGCSIQGEEKVLIYEYMPNKSLDSFLFGNLADSSKSGLLDWSKRFNIIFGIARGLLYLHQDSRLRIIHRDMKASNILLDSELNPKISDFGVARMFSGNQTEGNTKMVVGTYGYMAPEYAIDGLFSVKSDVYSFGVLLLEMAWRLWKENTPMELVDTSLGDSFTLSEVVRCIHVGLLCVQLHPEDRPNMASVIFLLSSENTLPQPKEPGFLMERMNIVGESSTSNQIKTSTNELTLTLLEAR
ncbi:hypothetical protein VNO78_06341 [Psophocarpus tetragonolobus]|uniref:non-specific serine/threonine protein kinase n=1 Tax=Psophocarpus tetragonolobus TaxID=3891 RepID=A0AAN9XRH0_PSOTE